MMEKVSSFSIYGVFLGGKFSYPVGKLINGSAEIMKYLCYKSYQKHFFSMFLVNDEFCFSYVSSI